MNLYDLLEEREEWRRSLSERLNAGGSPVVSELVSAKRRTDAEALVEDEMAREYEQRIEAALQRLRKAEEAE